MDPPVDSQDLGQPALLSIAFSWSPHIFEESIKAAHSNYHLGDPATWPTIGLVPHPNSRKRRSPSWLPFCVAYPKSSMELWCRVDSTFATGVDFKTGLLTRFRFYPYNFDRKGQLRELVGLPREDYKFWMLYVHGVEWPKWFGQVKSKSNEGNKEAPTTFIRIMDKLSHENDVSSEVSTLGKELKTMKETLVMKERALKTTKENLEREQAEHAEAKSVLSALRREMSRKDREIEKFRNEAKEAKGNIEKIWEQMQKMEVTVAKKRKSENPATGL